jgi:hypothetical protein
MEKPVRKVAELRKDFAASILEFARGLSETNEYLRRIHLVHKGYPGDKDWPYPEKALRGWARGRQKQ